MDLPRRVDLPRRILVPTDFSETADYALEYAVALAERIGALVDVLHVYPTPVVPPDIVITVSMLEHLARAGEESLRRKVDPLRNSGVIGDTMIKGGDARDAIIETVNALNIDLVIMGTHGKRDFRALFGSVTEGVLRSITTPVLALKPRPLRAT
ncbi:MAG TPA: universal stress protein [Polyangiales bacterium]|nr:universal stress protein [Polyangiales bacterium]